jgi:hypothetical protein
MDHPIRHRTPVISHPPTDNPVAEPTSEVAPSAEKQPAAQASQARRVAIPECDSIPSFDNVFALAVTSALLDQTVLVVCMTEEVLRNWQHHLKLRAKPVEGLTLLDGQFAWSADWRAFFHSRNYDVAVLHGIHAALQDRSLPLSYAKRLADAVRTPLIILA